jgi:hypothetical protein
VRELRIYNSRIARSDESSRFFVSFKKGNVKDFYFNGISSWLKHCITLAYQCTGSPLPGTITAHSVRSMAVSWASLRNVGVNSLMEACFWKAKNTFVSFYLKDLTEVEDDVCRLGRLPVSSSIV